MAASNFISVSQKNNTRPAKRSSWPDFHPHQQQSLSVFHKVSAQSDLVILLKLVLHHRNSVCSASRTCPVKSQENSSSVWQSTLSSALSKKHSTFFFPWDKKDTPDLLYHSFAWMKSSFLKPIQTAAPNLSHPSTSKSALLVRRQTTSQDTSTYLPC